MDVEHANLHEMENVKQFVTCGDAYCALLENNTSLTSYEFLRQITVTMANLYAAALLLPEVECSDLPVSDSTKSSERKSLSGEAIKTLSHKLRDFESYWEVFNPFENEAPVRANLLDDLNDIYHDYRRYLESFRSKIPGQMCEAVWHWKFMFEVHWGDHLVDALRAIHRLITLEEYGFRSGAHDARQDERGDEETRAE